MLVVSAFAALIACVLLLPTVSDIVSVIRIALGRVPRPAKAQASGSRLLFLIPAHDEEGLIADCVRSVLDMRYPRERFGVVVVADNCADRTAVCARTAGAECWERHDTALRGKPRAVAWALERVDLTSYDAVVILDADAVVDANYATELDRLSPLPHKAIECYDDVRNRADSALTRLAAVLSAARFRGAFRLKHVAGLRVPLSDGMCVGTYVLREHPWSAFGLSEDWEVYAMFAAMGVPIDLAVGAHLYAQETHTMRQSTSQRQRWLAGRITALATHGPSVLRSTHIGWHQKLDVLAELSSPGPAVHLATSLLLATLLLMAGAPGAVWVCMALIASLARPVAYAAIGIWHDDEPLRAAMALAALPLYSVWRLGVALRGLTLVRGGEWVRTARS